MVDLARRVHGVGASEAAMVLGFHPKYGPGDVWLRKAPKGKSPRIAEQLDDAEDDQSEEVADSLDDPGRWAKELGHRLEQVALQVYCDATGRAVSANDWTLSMRGHDEVMATPDGLVRNYTDKAILGGVEAKAVGGHNAHAWRTGVPAHYQAQALQCMAVCDTPWWDVVAIIGGTTVVLRRFERDAAAEDALVNEIGAFWHEHVMKDVPPESTSPEERRRILNALFPRATKERERVESPLILDAVSQFEEAQADAKDAKRRMGLVVNTFLEATGEKRGIFGKWGSFATWSVGGHISWKGVADDMLRATKFSPEAYAELIAKHTGRPSRAARLYPAKERP